MSIEVWSVIASVGTFVVITATAIAAVLQLGHMRSANKVAQIQTFLAEYEGSELRDAFSFVRKDLPKRLEDPEFRAEIMRPGGDRAKHPELAIANFFDQWGLYYRDGVIDRTSFMRVNAAIVDGFWRRLEPVIAIAARSTGGVNSAWEQFEYLTVQARQWLARHPNGDYPAGVERISLKDSWAEVDRSSLR
ncbi:MAG TPA: hypothetical protein VEV38_13870 [Candidatus Eremiobacteraceae bacterium]|nr:hypothetical protein [Candidatus Eremiobacteraceae bacterium]